MNPPINFFVAGEPKGQPRPRAFARQFGAKWQARVYDSGTAEAWKGMIATTWPQHRPEGFLQFLGPIGLTVIFHIKRPQSHYRSNGLLKPTAPLYCKKKPDADNYAKAVMDCLTQLGVWADDSQVCDLRSVKMFADNGTAGAHIIIKELDENP